MLLIQTTRHSFLGEYYFRKTGKENRKMEKRASLLMLVKKLPSCTKLELQGQNWAKTLFPDVLARSFGYELTLVMLMRCTNNRLII